MQQPLYHYNKPLSDQGENNSISNKLSPRLYAIASQVPSGARVADIGTDHAYIPIYLVQNKIVQHAIASDVRQGPVDKAIRNVIRYGLANHIDVRLGNGLEKIKNNEVDTVILAGMGGVLMTEILSNALPLLQTIQTLILQPNIGPEEVRKWLEKERYKIINEELVEENNKLYNIIVAAHGYEKIEKELYYYVGKKLIEKQNPLLNKFLDAKINELNKIIDELNHHSSANALVRLQECKERLQQYKALRQEQ